MLSALLFAFLFQPEPAIDCAATRVGFVGELAPWLNPVPATALLRPGTAYSASVSTPLTIEIATAGTYGFALDQAAWVDLGRDGRVLRSASHGHGPQSSGIRKIVDFALEPGRYRITLGRTQTASVRLLVIRR